MKNNVVQKLPIENDIKRKIKESETRRRQAKPKPYYSHKK